MRLSAKTIRLLSCSLIALLLFTQAAFATSPCVDPGMTATAAMANAAGEDCCDTSVTQANLCVMQCTDGSKLSAYTPVALPPAPTEPLLTLAYPDDALPIPRHWVIASSARDPPKSLRFCTFLI